MLDLVLAIYVDLQSSLPDFLANRVAHAGGGIRGKSIYK